MIFSIGFVLFAIGYTWYQGSPNYGDWRDTVQFILQVVGAILLCISLLTLAVKYLP
jgi:multisubunit Na+/H+ antiporter MnhB subunit